MKIQIGASESLAAMSSRCDVGHSTGLQEGYSGRVNDGSVQDVVDCVPNPPVRWLDLSKRTHNTLRPASAGGSDEGVG